MASLTAKELKAVAIVSLIISLRLLGIFIVLPIFSAYAIDYPGATLPLIGVAFGIYALVQSLFQIPFGWASDRFGRKRPILIGLFLFSLGSLACGMASNIHQLILARMFQGLGAIGAVATASLGDLTRPEVRAQAFTLTGISIGFAFLLGLISGPYLAYAMSFHSLFYILSILGFASLVLVGLYFPQTSTIHPQKTLPRMDISIIARKGIRLLYLATFILSLTLNMFFFIYPLSLAQIGIDRAHLWKTYIVVLIPSALLVFPYVRSAEKRGKFKMPIRIGWIFVVVAFLCYYSWGTNMWTLYAAGGCFFFGYTLFQSLLPAFLTQQIPPERRGSATGLYYLSGFLGASFGGMLSGILYHIDPMVPLIFGLFLIMVWFLLGLPIPPGKKETLL